VGLKGSTVHRQPMIDVRSEVVGTTAVLSTTYAAGIRTIALLLYLSARYNWLRQGTRSKKGPDRWGLHSKTV
jgi:hypothetical protein